MVLVDTSVWIDFLNGAKTPAVDLLIALLEREEAIAYNGLILQELLQGCADQDAASRIELHFEPLIEIFPQRTTYRSAAKIFRDCRRKGFTIHSSIDCLIAACALEHDCPVLHQDRDFTAIEKVCGLKVLRAES